MREVVYQKLVRDKIPEIIKKTGKEPHYLTLGQNEMLTALDQKLLEEAKEYIESGEAEELADVLEVFKAILKARGIDEAELEKIRVQKRAERGGFDDGVFLVRVIDP